MKALFITQSSLYASLRGTYSKKLLHLTDLKKEEDSQLDELGDMGYVC